MSRSSSFQAVCISAFTCVVLLFASAAFAQNYVAPSTPVVGSPNTVTANAPVPRPTTTPCTVTLFSDFDFDDFNPRPFSYTPPSGCPGPWAAVVFEADWSVDAGVQYDRTTNIWLGGNVIFFGTTAEPSRQLRSPVAHGEQSHRDQPAVHHSAAGHRDSLQPGQRPIHQPLSRQRLLAVLSAGARSESSARSQHGSAALGRVYGRNGHAELA